MVDVSTEVRGQPQRIIASNGETVLARIREDLGIQVGSDGLVASAWG